MRNDSKTSNAKTSNAKTSSESIDATRAGFEASFSEGSFYNKQTQDDEHLRRILEFLPLK